MNTPEEIAGAVGRKELAERLGVGLTAVSNAVVAGAFPSSWYPVVSDLCRERNVACPLSAFKFRPPSYATEKEAS